MSLSLLLTLLPAVSAGAKRHDLKEDEIMNDILNKQKNDSSFPGVWDELIWRGLVKMSTDDQELRKILNGSPVSFYCGFDPTAPSLHVGNLVQLLVMRRLQLAGHRPVALVGGSTGLIGDPRPTAERVLNDEATVSGWVDKLQTQVEKFLSNAGPAPVKLVNNLDWFSGVSAINFLRDVGKFFRVNTMLKKDAVRTRLESDAGISFTEFSYQLLQASDFLELHKSEGCVLQTGGSDQWGNLIGGVELVGRATGDTVHALGTPLITNTDGTKFGKSEGNAIWLDPTMTSPFEFFQFWMNTADADVIDRIKVFTFLNRDEVRALELEVEERPGARAAQRKLAFEVTALVHGTEAAENAQAVSAVLFGTGDLNMLDPKTLADAMQSLNDPIEVEEGQSTAEVAVAAGVASSLGEARRLMKQNGLTFNHRKLEADTKLRQSDFINGRFMLVKKGKKTLVSVVVKD
jgi:tyrosyl-tRNA synthetase